jgi:hypothetical protein
VQPAPAVAEPEEPEPEEPESEAEEPEEPESEAEDDSIEDGALAELAGAEAELEAEELELEDEPAGAAGVLLLPQPASARLKATATATVSVWPVRWRRAVIQSHPCDRVRVSGGRGDRQGSPAEIAQTVTAPVQRCQSSHQAVKTDQVSLHNDQVYDASLGRN